MTSRFCAKMHQRRLTEPASLPHTHFTNSYTDLGDEFYQAITPTPVKKPELIIFNDSLYKQLGLNLEFQSHNDIAAVFSGNRQVNAFRPIAMAYSGHQFGHFNPGLGDGRAILLGQFNSSAGQQHDIQLKGSGQTRFSRNGDGRSALGPVLREYLLSEAMHKLGVPTTRALAAVTSGELVARERLTPGGIITRVATSFVRVGTFQYFLYRDDTRSVRKLADYVIRFNYPELEETEQPYLALLKSIVDRQAALIARWMQLGFIHGVMNTDNMSIAGETIDYGPCAFMDHYSHDQVYSSIDRHGRYAYNQQPNIGLWNLTRLAETFLPLISDDTDEAVEIAQQVLKDYIGQYQQYWLDGMRSKIGLDDQQVQDKPLIDELFDLMHDHDADFTLSFYYLSQLDPTASDKDHALHALFDDHASIKSWLEQWRMRKKQGSIDWDSSKTLMKSTNPVYIPRNHQVEAVIRAAEDHGNFSLFHQLHKVLQAPFDYNPERGANMQPPEAHEVVAQTFCGT